MEVQRVMYLYHRLCAIINDLSTFALFHTSTFCWKKYLIDLLCVNHKTTRSIAKKSGDKKDSV